MNSCKKRAPEIVQHSKQSLMGCWNAAQFILN